MDKLTIEGFELWMKIGCTAQERAFPQRLLLDIEMELPLRAAGEKDDMARTVDYARVMALLKKSLEAMTCRLAETVAERAAVLVLKNFKPESVRVKVRKKALPGLDHFGVDIRRP